MSFVHSTARLVFAAAVCGACANLLDISPPGVSSEGPAGAAGAAGESNEGASSGVGSHSGGEAGDAASFGAGHGGARGGASGASNAGGGASGEAGSGGDVGNVGGAGRGATDAGGESGASDGGTAAGRAGAGAGNEAGDGGAAGAEPEEWPVSGAPCSVPGRFACYMPASVVRFVCQGGVWLQTDSCSANYFCDRRTGTCALQRCDGGAFGCSGDHLMICGPDLVDVSLELCDFGCIPGETANQGACAQQTVQQLLIDRPGGQRFEGRYWPSPAIPVCFRNVASSADNEDLREAIRYAVDTTWGRYDGVTFVGWNDCAETGDGIEIELLDDCEGTLANVPRVGYPGNEAVLSLGICRSYFDVNGDRHPRPEAPPDLDLVGFIAQHVFGHALGLEDIPYDAGSKQVMERALDLPDFENVELGWGELYQLRELYGAKPSGVWLAPSGRCLGARAGVLESAACDGAETALWQLTPAGMLHTPTGACLVRDGAQVVLGACTGVEADAAFRLDRVRLQAPSARCVSQITPGAGQSPLVLTVCDPSWPAAQRFGFEVLEGDRVRIRTSNGSCVRWPSDWIFPARPEIGECDGVRDTFEARSNRIEIAGRCLHSDSGELEFRACYETPEQRLYVSGPFELGSSTLTLTGSVAAPVLELTPLSFPPSDAQVFDYHF